MQTLLERRGSFGAQQQQAGGNRHTTHAAAVLGCVGLAAYVALIWLPTLSMPTIGEESPPADSSKRTSVSTATKAEAVGSVVELTAGVGEVVTMTMQSPLPPGVLLEPWGYNKDRNVNRWKALYTSIASDFRGAVDGDAAHATIVGDDGNEDHRFLVVDYGADQGYFSLAIASAFPDAVVMAVEAGGVGGSIWERGKKLDVLKIQEHHAERLHVPEGRFVICQTKVSPRQFFDLSEKKVVARYQLVLSVFHWFKLATVEDFQRTLVTLLMNAETTFLELPTIGDRGELIRKQVGWEHFSIWYENHTNVRDVIAAACKAEGLSVTIRLLVSAPWLRWTRDVFRIDVARESLPQPRGGGAPRSLAAQCMIRTSIYQCAPRLKHSSCPPPKPASRRQH